MVQRRRPRTIAICDFDTKFFPSWSTTTACMIVFTSYDHPGCTVSEFTKRLNWSWMVKPISLKTFLFSQYNSVYSALEILMRVRYINLHLTLTLTSGGSTLGPGGTGCLLYTSDAADE